MKFLLCEVTAIFALVVGSQCSAANGDSSAPASEGEIPLLNDADFQHQDFFLEKYMRPQMTGAIVGRPPIRPGHIQHPNRVPSMQPRTIHSTSTSTSAAQEK